MFSQRKFKIPLHRQYSGQMKVLRDSNLVLFKRETLLLNQILSNQNSITNRSSVPFEFLCVNNLIIR